MTASTTSNALIVRSSVAPATNYKDYHAVLRYDFWYSCAYCTVTESEAQAFSFTIDHYEPRSAEPALEHVYDNLLYCCETCNRRKSDRTPPPAARALGHRFFRPDQDNFNDHFVLSGQLLSSTTNTGRYTIEAVDLNRATLRRLRELRQRASDCVDEIEQGVSALISAKIDRLPANIRGYAYTLRKRLVDSAKSFETSIEGFLREQAASPYVGSDDDKRSKSERATYLSDLKAMFPDAWTGRELRGKRA